MEIASITAIPPTRAAPTRHHALALPLAEVAAEQLVQLGCVGLEPRVGLALPSPAAVPRRPPPECVRAHRA